MIERLIMDEIRFAIYMQPLNPKHIEIPVVELSYSYKVLHYDGDGNYCGSSQIVNSGIKTGIVDGVRTALSINDQVRSNMLRDTNDELGAIYVVVTAYNGALERALFVLPSN